MQHWRRQHIERGCAPVAGVVYGRRQIIGVSGANDQQFFSVVSRRRLHGLEVLQACDIGIRKGSNALRARNRFDQDVLSLAVKIGRHQADAGGVTAGAGQRGYIRLQPYPRSLTIIGMDCVAF